MTRTAHKRPFGKLLASLVVILVTAGILAGVLVPSQNAAAADDLFADGTKRALPVGESAAFDIAGLAAGQSVSGTAVVKNGGQAEGHFSLTRGQLLDGAEGATLAEHMTLVIVDTASNRELYRGSVADFQVAELGLLAPGAECRLSLAVSQHPTAEQAGGHLTLSFASAAVTGA